MLNKITIFRDPCYTCKWCNKPPKNTQEFSTCANPVIMHLLRKEKMIIACRTDNSYDEPCVVAQMMNTLEKYPRIFPDTLDVALSFIPTPMFEKYHKAVVKHMYIDCKDEFGTKEELYIQR